MLALNTVMRVCVLDNLNIFEIMFNLQGGGIGNS